MILITKIETQEFPDDMPYIDIAHLSYPYPYHLSAKGIEPNNANQHIETVQPRRFQTVGGTRRLIAMTSEVEQVLEMPFDAWDTLQREREEAIDRGWDLSDRLLRFQKSPWWRRLLWSLTLNEGWL